MRHYYPESTGTYQLVSSFAAAPALAVTPGTQNVVAYGSNSVFSVNSNTTWSWSVDQSWVTTSEAVSQSGDQTFTYYTEANPTTSPRMATVTVTAGALTGIHVITQAGAVVDDHGNDIGSASLVGQDSTTNGNIGIPGDEDFFRINVTGIGTMLLQTTGSTDTYGYLLDSIGTPLVADDDSGAGFNFLISYAVSPGTYYVRVRNYSSTNTGAYQLVSSFTAAPTLGVSPLTQSVAGNGATFNFAVSSNTAWTWSSSESWVTSSEAASQSGNQTFSYTVVANPSSVGRSAIITLTAGALTATHTVNQDPAELPDLMDPGTYYGALPANLAPGDAMTIAADVLNQGTGVAGAYTVKFYLSADTTITSGDIYLGENVMGALAIGATRYIDKNGLIVPESTPDGVYYAGWIYDSANVVVESDETNNTSYVPGQTIMVADPWFGMISQTVSDGSQSNWGDLSNTRLNYMVEANLTTAVGTSIDAFDGIGFLTLSPAITLPRLKASTGAGPLSTSASYGSVTATRTVNLVAGQHATDEQITLINTSGTAESVNLAIADNYGSDGWTTIHGTSSGDSVVAVDDNWFVSNDRATSSAISGDPTLLVSWRLSSGLPAPSFPTVPGAGIDSWTMNFGTFSLGAGQTVTVTIRRGLFDSADLALLNGSTIGGHEVTNLDDSGPGSLRALIGSTPPNGTITFLDELSGGIIQLTSGQLLLDKNLSIDASGLPNGIMIDGTNTSRVFQVDPGNAITMNRLVIANGNGGGTTYSGYGGGILNLGSMSLADSSLRDNSCSLRGGAAINVSGASLLKLSNCTVSGNTAQDIGGGIDNEAPLVLSNCTFTGNTSVGSGEVFGLGGAIFSFDVSLEITHCTFAGNHANLSGGGIQSQSGILTIQNSVIAGNTSQQDPDLSSNGLGTITTGGNNLIGDNSSVTTEFPAGPLVGTSGSPRNPLLAPLGIYGSLTRIMPPLPGSPSIGGAILLVGMPSTDQRGADRPSGLLPDIGAVEAIPFSTLMLADTDNDGIPDILEGPGGPYPQFTVGVNDSALDSDGDGSTDAEELANMTNPNNSNDKFRVLSFTKSAGFDPVTYPYFMVTVSTFPGLDYEFETGSELDDLQPITPDSTFTAGDFTTTFEVPFNPGLRNFLRAKRK